MLSKRGAMFGLDARIALAIFGALSVISGAALYSAIQQSKLTQAVAYLNEMTKSLESYALDVASLPPKNLTSGYFEIKELISSIEKGWKGPYTAHQLINCAGYTDQCVGVSYVARASGGASPSNFRSWKHDDAVADHKLLSCASGSDCFVWLSLWDLPISFANALDEKIDGVLDADEGRLRIITPSLASSNIYFNTGINVDQF